MQSSPQQPASFRNFKYGGFGHLIASSDRQHL